MLAPCSNMFVHPPGFVYASGSARLSFAHARRCLPVHDNALTLHGDARRCTQNMVTPVPLSLLPQQPPFRLLDSVLDHDVRRGFLRGARRLTSDDPLWPFPDAAYPAS